jgi:hypothetical protein
MQPPADPSRRSPSAARRWARVGDIFEIKASYGLDSPPGVVAVLDNFPSPDPESFVGRIAEIRTEAGHQFAARVSATRDHGPTISLFFEGLGREDIPIGSRIGFVDEPRGN